MKIQILIKACIAVFALVVAFGACPAEAQLTVPQEVWVAVRTDGQPGTGTITDPYDGSTQGKFDAIFAGYYNSNAINITFHLGSGTFESASAGWLMRTGWHVKGSGKDATTVYQTGPDSGGGVFGNVAGSSNQSVEDLTVDSAYFRLHGTYSTGNFAGVQLCGPFSFIRNVRVKHSGNDAGECFALAIVTYSAPWPDNAFIDNCEVIECGRNVSALTIASYGGRANPPVYAHNGRITNSRVDGANLGAGPPGGFDSGEVTGCTFTNNSIGIFEDFFSSQNIQLINNSIANYNVDHTEQHSGVVFNGPPVLSNFTISGNTMAVSDDGVGFAYNVTNSVISNNRIIDTGGGNHLAFALVGSGVNGIMITGNVIDPSLNLFNTAINITFCLNRTPDCQPVPGVPDNCLTVNPPTIIAPPPIPCSLP